MSTVAQNASPPKPNKASRRSGSITCPAQQDESDSEQNDASQIAAESPEGQRQNGKEKGTSAKRPSKRRKVNHACVYCRRSHMTCDQARPCSRCIKRNIPHLCHDEPRDSKRGSRGESEKDQEEESPPNDGSDSQITTAPNPNMVPSNEQLPNLTQGSILPNSGASNSGLPPQQEHGQDFNAVFNGFNNLPSGQFQDMPINPMNNMFNTSEFTNEYTLINNFLTSSLLEDSAYYQGEDPQLHFSDPSLANLMGPLSTTPMAPTDPPVLQPPTSNVNGSNAKGKGRSSNRRESSRVDKAQEKYYLTAADPGAGGSTEERMNKLLKLKYEAGLLKPFNYISGYARLNDYMERHMQRAARQKILHMLQRFRPEFRKHMQALTNFELVLVEIWFEKKLMEYDRVFAAMAIPSCCWRRTGEIFRGNREMAELIGVPVERLRDGKLAIHEFILEESLVDYWVKFGTIAFDTNQKGVLSKASLRRLDSSVEKESEKKCCFAFTVIRDNHSIPSLIIGNFLPIVQRK